MRAIWNVGIAVLVLAAAALGGAALVTATADDEQAGKPATLFAVWNNQPQTAVEAFALGRIAVRGTVESVAQADDIVVSAAGEPGGVDRVATQRITFRTNDVLKGQLGDTFAVFRTRYLVPKDAAIVVGNGGALAQGKIQTNHAVARRQGASASLREDLAARPPLHTL